MNKIPIDWQRVAKWSAALDQLNIADHNVRIAMEAAHSSYPEWDGVKFWMKTHDRAAVRLTAARKAYEEAIRL